jgi:phage gp36-like protein
MTYADVQDMVDKFGISEMISLSNIDNPAAVAVNDPIVLENLTDSSAEIDGYVSARYALPLPSVPGVLKSACLDMTRYRLDKNFQREDVRKRYEDWIRFLKDVSAGRASLGLNPDSGAEANLISAKISSPERIFTNNALTGY